MKNPVKTIRIINVGEEVMQDTIPMEAVPAKASLTVKDIIQLFIEPFTDAWKCLPNSVRERMLASPQEFEMVNLVVKDLKHGDVGFYLKHGHVYLRHSSALVTWVLHDIK